MKTKEERTKARDERLKRQIVPVAIRMRLLSLLEAGLIDISRLNDGAYLAQQIIDGSLYDQAPSRMFVQTEGDFFVVRGCLA